MTSCPKCKRLMTVLFQIPKCEVCELGGKEEPRYYAFYKPDALQKKGYVEQVAVFCDRLEAKRWHTFLTKTRDSGYVCQPVVLARSSPMHSVEWVLVDPDHPVVPGAKWVSGSVYLDEEAAQKGSNMRRFLVIP